MTRDLPRSRQDLIVKELDGELLVYDELSKKAFCLNASSAVIWKLCDGETTLAEMTERTAKALNAPIDDVFVSFALERLRKDGLLESTSKANSAVITRSQLMARVGRAGIAAAVAVPLVTAIMAPTAAKAYGEGGKDPWPPPSHGCVLYSTGILLADGRITPARDIKAGDVLMGVSAETGDIVPGAVASIGEFDAPGFFTFVASSGHVVNCSPTHPLIRGFGDVDGTPATELKAGDPLLVHDVLTGRAIESPIVTAAYSEVPQPVLVFEMDTVEHTYFTGGIVSHNKFPWGWW